MEQPTAAPVMVTAVPAADGEGGVAVAVTDVHGVIVTVYGMLATWSNMVRLLASLTQTPKRSAPAAAPALFHVHVAEVE